LRALWASIRSAAGTARTTISNGNRQPPRRRRLAKQHRRERGTDDHRDGVNGTSRRRDADAPVGLTAAYGIAYSGLLQPSEL
jgi:hypothetical protein